MQIGKCRHCKKEAPLVIDELCSVCQNILFGEEK